MGLLPMFLYWTVNIDIFRSFHEEQRPTQHKPWFIQKVRYGQVSLRQLRQFQTARQSQAIKTGINCYHSLKKESFRFCQKKRCQMSGGPHMVKGSCWTVSESFQTVSRRCQMVSGGY